MYSDSCSSITVGACGTLTDAGIDAAVSSCASPGGPTAGQPDTHCTMEGNDAGTPPQTVNPASCCVGADAGTGDDGGPQPCPYGSTMWGTKGDDDDCKYQVSWTSSPICEGSPGSQFVLTAFYQTEFTDAGTPLPLTGANVMTEVFTTTPGDASAPTYCDDESTHPGPTSGNHMVEGPPGTYTANIAFDQPGQWTVRFHFNEECADVADDSPHGHAAFFITVP